MEYYHQVKEIGNKTASQALILCTDEKCLNNDQLTTYDTSGASLMAKRHERVNPDHEAVVVYVDTSHPISESQAKEVLEMTLVEIPAELISSS